MGAEYLFYMKSIETHARAFLALIILGIGTVIDDFPSNKPKCGSWLLSIYLRIMYVKLFL